MGLYLYWFLTWFMVWGAYNVYFKWKIDVIKNEKHLFTSAYFLISSLVAYSLFAKSLLFSYPLIVAFLISLFVGTFFSHFYPFIRHIKNGKYFLISLSFSILFQHIMINVGVNIEPKYFGFIFMAGHLPVIFLKWARYRYLYLVLTYFGGTDFSYLITKYSDTGVITSYMLHYLFYIPIFYYVQDERKV
jgi:hypothetical protein